MTAETAAPRLLATTVNPLVGFAVLRFELSYDRSRSTDHRILQSIKIGPLHRTLQTAQRLRTIALQFFHQRLFSVYQRFYGYSRRHLFILLVVTTFANSLGLASLGTVNR